MSKRLLIYYPKGTNLSDAKRFLRKYIKNDATENIIKLAVENYSQLCNFYIREESSNRYLYGSDYAFKSIINHREFEIIKYTQNINKIMIGEI